MKPRTVLAISVLILTTVVCVLPGRADLSPGKVKKMRDQSEEVFVIDVTNVVKGDAINREELEVIYSAKIVKVIRSASGLKAGDEVIIQSYIRNPDLRVEPEPGALPPSLLPSGWVGTAYLSGTDKPKTLKIAVSGYSFVPMPTFWSWDSGWKVKSTYQLQPEGEELLTGLLARKPDSEVNAAVGLLPSGMLTYGDQEYAIEDDAIVLLGTNNTKIWSHKEIKQKLIELSERVVPVSKADRVLEITYREENYKVPKDEVWKLTWKSPYHTGEVHPAYDVRVLGTCFTAREMGTQITAYSSRPGEAGLVDVCAGDTPAEIWVAGNAEFQLANDRIKVRVEAYKTGRPE